MLKRFAGLVGAVFVSIVVAAAAFLIGMRSKSPVVLDAVRRTNRAVFNPRQMASAGAPGAFASVVRHVGRTSGRSYETPVGVVATDEGFVIALPYGSEADWLKNVLASGSATIVHEGSTYEVGRPEIISIDTVAEIFSSADQRAHSLFGVDECLRLQRI